MEVRRVGMSACEEVRERPVAVAHANGATREDSVAAMCGTEFVACKRFTLFASESSGPP